MHLDRVGGARNRAVVHILISASTSTSFVRLRPNSRRRALRRIAAVELVLEKTVVN